MPLWSGGMTVCDRLIAVSQPAQILAGFMVKSTPPTTYFMFAVHGLYVGAFSLQVLLVSLLSFMKIFQFSLFAIQMILLSQCLLLLKGYPKYKTSCEILPESIIK